MGDARDWSEVKIIRPQGVALFVAMVGSWDRNVPDLINTVVHMIVSSLRIRDADEMVFIDPS